MLRLFLHSFTVFLAVQTLTTSLHTNICLLVLSLNAFVTSQHINSPLQRRYSTSKLISATQGTIWYTL